MAAKKFRFVSPGVQIKEIDKSILPALPGAIGPVVIGRSLKGPAMVPVTVNSYEDFVQKFGEPSPGVSNRDIWRNGNDTGPTYGAYAAKAWLESSTPLTFLRLAGVENSLATSEGLAGWQTSKTVLNPNDIDENGGAYGLFVAGPDSQTEIDPTAAILALNSSFSTYDDDPNTPPDPNPFDITFEFSITQKEITGVEKTIVTEIIQSTVAPSEEIQSPDLYQSNNEYILKIYWHSDGRGTSLQQIRDLLGPHFNVSLEPKQAEYAGLTQGQKDALDSLTTYEDILLIENSTTEVETVINGGSFGTAAKAALAAVLYLDKGYVELVGDSANGTTVGDGFTGGANVFVKCEDNLGFKLKIHSSATESETVSVNFTKASKKFIRKALNTNPTLVNEAINKTTKTYWLGETFEDDLADKMGDENILIAPAESVYGFVVPLFNGNVSLANFRKDAEPAKTGWVISQHLNDNYADFDAKKMPKLFRFVAGEGLGGDFEQNNYKISVFDIKPPLNEFQKYGTFSVAVRRIADKDTSPEFVEVFSNLNLDPSSPNYVAARIGDRRIVWKDDRFVELGTFTNNSKIIRVEMSDAVENGEIDSSALPFGFFGPTRFKEISLSADGSGLASTDDTVISSDGSQIGKSFSTSNGIETQVPNFVGKVVMPSLPLLKEASQVDPSRPSLAFFGMKVEEPLNESLKDLLRVKPGNISSHVASDDEGTEYSFVFTLDDLKQDADKGAVWEEGSRAGGTSWTVADASGFEKVLENEYNKFTMPLVGGFDGLNIKEREPFRNTLLTDDSTEKNSYIYNSLKRAVDSVKDPEVLDMNLLVLPGVTNKAITNRMIRVCEDRADAMAIIDLEGGYVPSTENVGDEDSRLGSVSETITSAKNRGFNTSYACGYYPWVQMQDDNTGNKLWIPPSVVAFGTMASSQEDSEVWFAPAGFNRGGLTLGSSGLSVLNVRDKLTAKDRDALYEVSINPIASFPSEGLVIFGQKTLQAVPSALDRINVRRLVIFLKKEISRIASGLLFEPNVEQTWKRFSIPTTRLLEEVKTGFGISDYRVVLDSTTTTPEEIDRNMMYAKLFIKPVYAIEFIGIDFVITNTGASFDDL